MKKLTPTDRMIQLANRIADSITIPEYCTLDRDDIFQEVCLIYLEREYTGTPGKLKSRVTTTITNYVSESCREIPCGLLEDVAEYDMEMAEMSSVISDVIVASIEKVLKMLRPREEEVLRLRFGIDDDNPLILEVIGRQYEVTRDRIGQIEARAMRRCRHVSRYKYLKDAIEMSISGNYFM